jgi:hypothetical protein
VVSINTPIISPPIEFPCACTVYKIVYKEEEAAYDGTIRRPIILCHMIAGSFGFQLREIKDNNFDRNSKAQLVSTLLLLGRTKKVISS